MKWNYLVPLIAGVVILFGCAQSPGEAPVTAPALPSVPGEIRERALSGRPC